MLDVITIGTLDKMNSWEIKLERIRKTCVNENMTEDHTGAVYEPG